MSLLFRIIKDTDFYMAEIYLMKAKLQFLK